MTKLSVFVVGYPKSGTTWLMRLLGDYLNCPVGSGLPQEDAEGIGTEGLDRPGLYKVRRGHYLLSDREGGPVVPSPHRLAWRGLADEPVIFMARDPRDIVLSLHHWWSLKGWSLEDVAVRFLDDEPWKGMPSWGDYVESWLAAPFEYVLTRYEDLLREGTDEFRRILAEANLPIRRRRLMEAFHRQSFVQRKAWTERHGDQLNYGKKFQLRFLNRGEAERWRTELNGDLALAIQGRFGPTMRKLGYET